MTMDRGKILLVLFLAALLLRAASALHIYADVDTYSYVRMAQDFHEKIRSGQLFSAPFSRESYYAVEYWPFLYSFISAITALLFGGVEISARFVSVLFGALLVIPVYLLGSRLGDGRSGIVAAALAAFTPSLVFFSSVERTESLYIFFYTCGVLLTWRAMSAGAGTAVSAGLTWGLAYLTRFEGLMGAAIACVIPFFFRGKRMQSVLILAGFLVAASPYVIHLHARSGVWTFLPPGKVLYDGLEASFVARQGMSGIRKHWYRFGAPGERSFVEIAAAARDEDLRVPPGSWAAHLPTWFSSAAYAFGPLLLMVILLAIVSGWRSCGNRVLLAFCLPAASFAVSQFWDVNYRYFGFAVPLLIAVAAPQIISLYDEWDLSVRARSLLALLFMPVLIFQWRIPGSRHADHAEFIEIGRVSLLNQIAAAKNAGFYDLLFSHQFFHLRLLLLLVAGLVIYYYGALRILMDRERGRPMRRLLRFGFIWFLIVCLQNIAVDGYAGGRRYELAVSQGAAAFLRQKEPGGFTLMCDSPWNARLAGAEWVRFPRDVSPEVFRDAVITSGAKHMLVNEDFDYGIPGIADLRENLRSMVERREIIEAYREERSPRYGDGVVNVKVYAIPRPPSR